MNMTKVIGDEFPEYISYQMSKIFLVLEDVYSVGSMEELQEAIDTIGTGAGTIFIEAGTYDVTVPIDIDNCGSIVIYGHGDNTVLRAADGITVFNITCCASLLIKTLKIDGSLYTAPSVNVPLVIVNEGIDNVVGFSDVTIEGLNNFGRGIELRSNNCIVEHCTITFLSYGVNIASDYNIITQNTLSINEIGIYHGGSYCNITGNTCNSNTTIGIYIAASLYSNISNNTCNFNPTGISVNASNHNTISNNIASSNTFYGMYMILSNHNTLSGNTTDNNDSNSAMNTGGIYLAGDCDFNTISGNSCNNNNNIGAGTAYGIIISAATCDENVVAANNANGNDIDFQDSGTDTTIEYFVQDEFELQDAIDSIGSKSGVINIEGSFAITATIGIDNAAIHDGSYIIRGDGSNTTLTPSGDFSCFLVREARSVVFENFKISAVNLLLTTVAISINENSDNSIFVNNVEIVGAGAGYGIQIDSPNCRIENCNISGMANGIVPTDEYCIIIGNICNSNSDIGIFLNTANYITVQSNTCRLNAYGIYLTSSNKNLILGNTIEANTADGIFLNNSDQNTFEGNIIDGNITTNVATDHAGITLSNSLTNFIIGNTIINNNNGGAGIGYGIYIVNAACTENVVRSNNVSGNDINYKDNGVKTQITYYVSNEDDLQDALDSIAAKSAIINIQDSFNITATIDVDGGGSYIIQGEGANTTLTTVGDITCINITSARSCLLQNFKIDASSLTTPAREIIDVTEALHNTIIIDNIEITGDGANGRGIEINSNNCRIEKCNIDNVSSGIEVLSNNNIINGNNLSNNQYAGIRFTGNYNNSTSNICNSTQYGIILSGADNNIVLGNTIKTNIGHGIFVSGSSQNTLEANMCDGNDSNTVNPQAGIYIINNSNNNFVINNTSINNNNAGAGKGYGVYIGNANCENNIVKSNNCSGNDIKWKDLGTNSDFEYRCSTAAEIQDAVDSIAAKSGIIHILSGTITLTATIDVDGGGNYVIEGEGEGTIIETADATGFNITSATSCVLRDFKIDCTAFTAARRGIYIAEAANNTVSLESIVVSGDGVNGFGVEIVSSNCRMENCEIENMNYGIVVRNNNNILTGNYCHNNIHSGIYIGDTSHYNNLTSNISNSNYYGIFLISSDYNIILGNTCNSNVFNGIYITASDYNSIQNNIYNGNDSNTANPQAGIYITTNSNNNFVIGNASINNNNAGAGIGYGIYVATADCVGNIVRSNNCSGNDIQWKDIGTNSDFEYRCSTAAEIQDAVNSIAAKTGIINILIGNIELDATTPVINVNLAGNYVIQGQGNGSVIDAAADRTVFDISSVATCIIRNLKIDATDLTTPTKEIINVTDDNVIFERVTIVGDGVNGYGIEINSDNCVITHCNISTVNIGINIGTTNNKGNISNNIINDCVYGIKSNAITVYYNYIISGNVCYNHSNYAMYLDGSFLYIAIEKNICYNSLSGMYIISTFSTIDANILYSNTNYGIMVQSCNTFALTGNMCHDNGWDGIRLRTVRDSVISGNICSENISLNTINGQGGIVLFDNCDRNSIIGNICYSNINGGAGIGYGIWIREAGSRLNRISGNSLNINDTNYLDNGTDTILFGDDTVYGAGWNADLGTATKNAIWNKIEAVIAGAAANAFATITGITNDVIADGVADILELAAVGGLTIIGDAANDKITFTNTITQYTNALAVAAIEAAGLDFATTIALGFVDDVVGVFIDRIYDEDDMASDDEHGLVTQQSSKAYTDAKVLAITDPIGIKKDYFGTGIKGNILTRDYEISVANGDDFDMKGWFVANGQAATPNCLNKVIRNEATSGVIGGSDDAVVVEHNHGASQVAHVHGVKAQSKVYESGAYYEWILDSSAALQNGYISSETPAITVDNEGVSGVGENIPAKISAIPVIRMS